MHHTHNATNILLGFSHLHQHPIISRLSLWCIFCHWYVATMVSCEFGITKKRQQYILPTTHQEFSSNSLSSTNVRSHPITIYGTLFAICMLWHLHLVKLVSQTQPICMVCKWCHLQIVSFVICIFCDWFLLSFVYFANGGFCNWYSLRFVYFTIVIFCNWSLLQLVYFAIGIVCK